MEYNHRTFLVSKAAPNPKVPTRERVAIRGGLAHRTVHRSCSETWKRFAPCRKYNQRQATRSNWPRIDERVSVTQVVLASFTIVAEGVSTTCAFPLRENQELQQKQLLNHPDHNTNDVTDWATNMMLSLIRTYSH